MFRFTSNPSPHPKKMLTPGFTGEKAQKIGNLMSQILLPDTTVPAVQFQIASLDTILQDCEEGDLMSRTLLDTILPSGKSLHLGGDTFLNFLYAEAARIFHTSSTTQQKTGATTDRLYQLVKLLMDAVKLHVSKTNAVDSASAEAMKPKLSVYAKMITTHNFAYMYPLHRVLEMGDIRCTQQLLDCLQYLLDNKLYPVPALQSMLLSPYKSKTIAPITTPLALVLQHKNIELLNVFLPFYIKVVGVKQLMDTITEQKITRELPDSMIQYLEKSCATEADILPQIPIASHHQPQTKILPYHITTIERALSHDRYLEGFTTLLQNLDQYTLENMRDSKGSNLLMIIYQIASTQIYAQNLEGTIKIAYSERVTKVVNLLFNRSEQLTQLDGTQKKISLFILTHFQNKSRPFTPMHAAITTGSPIILDQYMRRLFFYIDTRTYSRENLQLMLTTPTEQSNPLTTALAYASQTASQDVLHIIINAMGTVLSASELLRHLIFTRDNLVHSSFDEAQKAVIAELLSAEHRAITAHMISKQQAQASASDLTPLNHFQAPTPQQAPVVHRPLFYPQKPRSTNQAQLPPPIFGSHHTSLPPQAYHSSPLSLGVAPQPPVGWVRPVGFGPHYVPQHHVPYHVPPHQIQFYTLPPYQQIQDFQRQQGFQPPQANIASHPTQPVLIPHYTSNIAFASQLAQSFSAEQERDASVVATDGAHVSVGANPHTLLAAKPQAGSTTKRQKEEDKDLIHEASKTSLV